jgi:glycerophosphoryl diester phosphodiesterase
MRDRPYIIAHQGASGLRPPNTLAAFAHAIELGSDWIELDVVTTADDIVVVSHDTTVDAHTDGHGYIAEMTWPEIARLDAGVRFGAEFAGERIPTLEQAIAFVRDQPIRLCIEIKADTDEEYRRTAIHTVPILQESGYLPRVVITSFGQACVRAVKALEPRLSVALDPDPQDGTLSPWELCQQVLECGANFMLHDYGALTADIVDEAHQHGFSLWAWTTDDPAAMRRITAMGADGIMTNRPDILARVQAEDARR